MAFFSRPSSSAVKIVAPSSSHSEPTSPKATPRKDTTQRQCRNILIYGSCKYQDKGCIYYHPTRETASPAPPDSPTPAPALPAQAVNAPVFVPKNPASPTPAPAIANLEHALTSATPPTISPEYYYDESETYDFHLDMNGDQNLHDLADQFQALDPSMVMNPYEHMGDPQEMGYENGGGMDQFYPASQAFAREPLQYHLYTSPRPETLQNQYFIADDLREELQKRSEAVYTAPPPGLNLPDETQGYHSLMPLEVTVGERRKFGSWYSTVYKAVNSTDGFPYALRRIENFRLNTQAAFSGVETWARIKHPNVVGVKEAFTTRAFNDNSLVVVYDYHPNSETLFEAYIKPKAPQFQNGRLQAQHNRISERTLWTYIIQIASAIKAVHEAGLAVRVIDVTKVIVTGQNRCRVSSCGIVDILMFEARHDIAMLQQEDLAMFGKLIVSLCCSSLTVMNNLPKAVETAGRHYSAEVKNILMYLLTKPHKNIRHLFELMKGQMLLELDDSLKAVDCLESNLMSELENGRLVRLLCKFGFIDERPEFARDLRWSETGDRYIIKLFRDYVFHQVDEHGRPILNLSHVLTSLNKLDAGVEERIMLVSRDEQSCLVVSYREIKSCIDSAFRELTTGAAR